jgi:hypothetical protein
MSTIRARRGLTGRLVTLLLAAPLIAAACGTISSSPPPETPTSFPGLAGRLNTAGIRVSDWISGDAGCTDPDMVSSGISFKAQGLDQATPVKLHLYVFRNRAAFERHRAQVGPCAAAYVTDPAAFEQVEQSPYVVASQGPWAPAFKAALRSTLELASGTGG